MSAEVLSGTPPAAMRDITTIYPYDKNVKTHDAKQVEKIANSIKKFGWVGNPIVVNGKGLILAGHGRRLAALSLAMTEVPHEVISNLSPEAERAYRLADNRVAISNIDFALLQQELEDLEFDLDGIFDKKELDFVVADLGEMKLDAFVSDLDEEIANQSAETSSKIKEADERDIKVEKALGFKSFKGSDERRVARFMAQVEADTGKTGAEAFVAFINLIMQPAAVQG